MSNKLPEEELESELREDRLSWLSVFKKLRRETFLGVGKHARLGVALGADLLLAV